MEAVPAIVVERSDGAQGAAEEVLDTALRGKVGEGATVLGHLESGNGICEKCPWKLAKLYLDGPWASGYRCPGSSSAKVEVQYIAVVRRLHVHCKGKKTLKPTLF